MVQETPLIILCGPTSVGKTAAAIDLAQKIGAEIVSADSGQIYREMDIGTAKPTLEERRDISFHLIDILNPDQKFSAADFRKRALEAIRKIQSQGRRVILAGGTGLYLKALEEGLFEGPPADPKVREELERQVRERGVESLHRDLQKIDPVAAPAIPPRNRQRLIRALEVYRLTGRPISRFWHEHQRRGGPAWPPGQTHSSAHTFLKFGLMLPKEELHRRIEERVDRMMEEGLAEEVQRILKSWGDSAPGLKLIGYKEIVSHLKGDLSLKETIFLIKQNTRQYAKRQRTWFKKNQQIRWVSNSSEIIQLLTK